MAVAVAEEEGRALTGHKPGRSCEHGGNRFFLRRTSFSVGGKNFTKSGEEEIQGVRKRYSFRYHGGKTTNLISGSG